MKNSIKSLDVFEFREEDEELPQPNDLSDHDSERLSKKNAAVIRMDTDAGNMDYDHNVAGSFSNLETEEKPTLNHVLRFKFGSSEQCAETKFNVSECDSDPVCLEDQENSVFPEHSNNNGSVCLDSYADGSMSERSSSPISENSDCSDGQSSEKYFSGLDLDEDNGEIIFHPDYIDYSGAHHMYPLVSFSKNSVEVSNRSFQDVRTTCIRLEIDDIVKLESQWSARKGTGIINIYFISKKEVRSDTVYNGKGIEKFGFAAMDSNWHKKQEAIESLNLRYKAVWDHLLDTGYERCSALTEGEAWVPQRKYFPDFDKPFDEVIYPKGDPDAVSLSKRDIDLLRPDTFVNDTIIDFYIKYLQTKLNEEERVKFHFFNSFFFRKLADMDKDPNSAQDARAAFLRVRKWTRKVNFLEKDFIFIPVNYNYHWSVIVICYFGEAGICKDVDREKSLRVPCILHMDSFKGSHAGLEGLMQSYLWEEWKERKTETCEDLYSKFKNMKFVSLELPQQPNLYDCGLFLLHYVELFLEDVPMNFNIHKLTSSSKFLQADWFSPDDASLKRAHIERLINDLIDTHSEEYSTNDGRNDLDGSPNNPTTNDVHGNSVERLEEASALTSSYHESSVCVDVGRGIEMTLLQASPVRCSTQCTTSSGFVLKELFESGPATESFSDAPWQEFEGKESVKELKKPDFTIEEIQTGLLEPPSLQHPDTSPMRSESDNPSDTEAKGNCYAKDVELEKPPCMSSEVTEQVSLLEPAPVDGINDAESVEFLEGDHSKNMQVFEEPKESKSEDEHRTPKRMRIEALGSL